MRALAAVDKEVLATVLFAGAGVAGLALSSADWAARAPVALFYATLVVNTWFSIRFFSRLPPTDRDESLIDGILTVLYLALAFAIGRTIPFLAIATLLFVAAVSKYALLRGVVPFPRTLRRKMFIDFLGVLLCLAALLGAVAGFEMESAWALALAFLAANIFLLLVRPMYRVFDPGGP